MLHQPNLVDHFRSFLFLNPYTDIEAAINAFSVFGGTPWKLDISKPLTALIEEKILKNYRYIHAEITQITQSKKEQHALLTALAQGDSREHSAFKRSQLSRHIGESTADQLIDQNMLIVQQPVAKALDETQAAANKLKFSLPFMRFWFAFVSPHYKSIKAGDFSEVKSALENRLHELSEDIYLELFKAYLAHSDMAFKRIGSYWDKSHTIEILGQTKTDETVIGSLKLSKQKMKISEYNTLIETAKTCGFEAQIILLFSKSGYTENVKKAKNPRLRLFGPKHLKALIESISQEDLLEYDMKRY